MNTDRQHRVAPEIERPSREVPVGLRPLVVAAVVVTMTLWASAFVVTRAIGPAFSPAGLAFGRVAVASLALGAVVLAHRGSGRLRPPRGRAAAVVLTYGAVWFGAYTAVFTAAEGHLDAGTTALLVNIAPVLVAVGAGALLGEGLPRRLVTGLAVAFVGVAVIAATTSTGRHDVIGVALAVLAAVLYAAGILLQKVALRSVDPILATWLGALAGTMALAPFAPDLFADAAAATAGQVAWLIYLGLFPTALAFTTWAYALSRVNAGAAASSSYAVPALAVIMSWLFLGEAPAPLALLGGALCLGGVAISTLPRRR